MTDEEDRRLVDRCLNGDRDAFAGLVDRHQQALLNIAVRMVGNYDDAREIAQASFVKAYEKLATYKPEHRFVSWIYRIAVNESINFLNRRRRLVPLEDRFEAGTRSPDEEYEHAAINDQIDLALQELSPDHRLVIVLRHFLQMSMRDIALVLRVPEKRVKSRLFTARQSMRGLLKKRGVAST
jgi:RNA polymerase sigma-70 factor, ECF subfamily